MSTDACAPFELSPEREAATFELLKARLTALWSRVFPRDDEPYTAVVVPSVTLDDEDLVRARGALFYEEVLLFFLIRLRNPLARVVYVTSQPLPQALLDYYLQFLGGVPASHAVSRLTLLSAHDSTPRPLTRKILERPRLLQRIRAAIPDRHRAYLTVLRSTPLERRLAVLLDVPLNAADPGCETLCTKSGARKVLREAGVDVPLGREDLRSQAEIVDALETLRRQRPGLRHALLNLDTSFWDEGHAIVRYPASGSREDLRAALRRLAFSTPGHTPDSYLDRLRRGGGVVEELIEAPVRTAASGQVRISPLGEATLTSSHDELRGGPAGLTATGCLFPADDAYRARIQEASLRVGGVLAAKGVVSRLSIEFVLWHAGDGAWNLAASEINFGVGGSTHPLLAVRFLAGGALDPRTGLFHSHSGAPKFYRATDHLESDAYRGLLPEDVIEILTLNHLHYSPRTETGALFYMVSGVSELGRLGMVAIGNSREEAQQVYARTVATLDAEAHR
jgi:hypothetical protein